MAIDVGVMEGWETEVFEDSIIKTITIFVVSISGDDNFLKDGLALVLKDVCQNL